MQTFPMFLKMTDRRVVIVGGGEQATQKARLMLKTEARLVLVSPTLEDELAQIVAQRRATHQTSPVTVDTFADTALVFVATGCPGADACLQALAKAAGALVNVVDQPHLCDALTPSIVDRDPVVVAIGTEGTAPVLARQIKSQVEQLLDPRLGTFAALAGRLRGAVAARIPRQDRRAFWEWAFQGAPFAAHRRGAEREAATLLKSSIATGLPGKHGGWIALVGAGPGARDLLTLRAVERLQTADVIFYDRLVDPDVLELARRDAERIFVGKVVGAHAWPQDRINARVVAEARRGRRVVRLKSGDPSIFGRATEELDAARSAGIPVEMVPGVTAACAAAASLGLSLTERGVSDSLVFATGTCQEGQPVPDPAQHAVPGTSLAFYMSARNARSVEQSLLAKGIPGATPVRICVAASLPDERLLVTSLGELSSRMDHEGINSHALILLTVPKCAAGQAVRSGIVHEPDPRYIAALPDGRSRTAAGIAHLPCIVRPVPG